MADSDQKGNLEVKCEPGSPEASRLTTDGDCNEHVKRETESEQEEPLDFSCRRRSVSSSASRSPQPSSPHSAIGSRHSENGDVNHDENSRSHSNSSASDSDKIGEPKLAKAGTVPGTVFPGMIPGMTLPNFSGLPAGLSSLAGAAGFLAGMTPSALASMLDQRKTNQQGNKGSRPFKAYPKDPLSLPLGYPYTVPSFMPMTTTVTSSPELSTAQTLNQSSEELFHLYRQQVLKAQEDLRKSKSKVSNNTSTSVVDTSATTVSSNSSPTSSTSSTSNSRKRPRIYPDAAKDESYWDRRRKNNEAAKRSRDARRAKEDEIAIRAAFLEQENLKLRVEVAALKTETAKLRCMLLNQS